jgi:hypothetical protein
MRRHIETADHLGRRGTSNIRLRLTTRLSAACHETEVGKRLLVSAPSAPGATRRTATRNPPLPPDPVDVLARH